MCYSPVAKEGHEEPDSNLSWDRKVDGLQMSHRKAGRRGSRSSESSCRFRHTVTVPVTTTSSWYLLDTYQQARRRQIARWQSLWVEHIQVQVASGNAAACRPPLSRELLDSVVHPSRGWRRRVCVGSSSQLCPARARCCKATRPVPARPSCSIQHDMHTVAAEPRTPSRSPNAGKVTPPRPAPARVRPGPPEAGASSWRHGKLNFAVSRPGTD